MTDEIPWTDYYRENEGREPRALLLEVLGSFERAGEAVDLGCGAGIDTLAMLERGWQVFATDAEEEAIQRTRGRVPPELQPRLQTRVTPMEMMPGDTAVTPLELTPEGRNSASITSVMPAASEPVRPTPPPPGARRICRYVAPHEDKSSFSEAQARALFEGWTLERFEEEENDGDACDGPKHWHVFHAVATARSS